MVCFVKWEGYFKGWEGNSEGGVLSRIEILSNKSNRRWVEFEPGVKSCSYPPFYSYPRGKNKTFYSYPPVILKRFILPPLVTFFPPRFCMLYFYNKVLFHL